MRPNLKSVSHRCYFFQVEFVWELIKETIQLPLDCLQGGYAIWVQEDWDQRDATRLFLRRFFNNTEHTTLEVRVSFGHSGSFKPVLPVL